MLPHSDRKVKLVGTPMAILVVLTCLGCSTPTERGLPAATLQEQRAEAMLEAGQVAEARAAFEQAARMNPRPFFASVGLVRCGLRSADWELVDGAMKLAYAAAPRTAAAQDLLGRTHLEAAKVSSGSIRLQHATTARSMFAAASRREPDLPNLAYHTGMAELLSGRPAAAVSFLELAILEAPDSLDPVHTLVLALRRLDQRQRVVSVLEKLSVDGRLTPELAEQLVWAKGSGDAGRSPDR